MPTRTINISKAMLKFWRNALKRSTALPDYDKDGTIETLTANFGKGIEADIKLANSESGPYVDAVIFDRGHEIGLLDPSYSASGQYVFEADGIDYIVNVKVKHA